MTTSWCVTSTSVSRSAFVLDMPLCPHLTCTSMTSRHQVTLCKLAKPRTARMVGGKLIGTGRSAALFAFSWADVAALLGVKIATARKLAGARRFDVTDLESLARFWAERRD